MSDAASIQSALQLQFTIRRKVKPHARSDSEEEDVIPPPSQKKPSKIPKTDSAPQSKNASSSQSPKMDPKPPVSHSGEARSSKSERQNTDETPVATIAYDNMIAAKQKFDTARAEFIQARRIYHQCCKKPLTKFDARLGKRSLGSGRPVHSSSQGGLANLLSGEIFQKIIPKKTASGASSSFSSPSIAPTPAELLQKSSSSLSPRPAEFNSKSSPYLQRPPPT